MEGGEDADNLLEKNPAFLCRPNPDKLKVIILGF